MQKTAISGLFYGGFPVVLTNRPALKPIRLPAQMLKIMRLLTVFLFVASLAVSARPAAQTVTLSGKNLTLEQVFTTIKKQTGHVVVATQDIFTNQKTFSLSVTNLPLADFLNLILKNLPLEYEIADKTIFISPKSSSSSIAQPEAPNPPPPPITGRITDSTGTPLGGATVSIRGKNLTVTTDAQGRFTLEAEPGDELTISYVGYKTTFYKITAGTSSVSISLKPAAAALDNVEVMVNTGYQQLSRERSAGAFGKPDMEIVANRSTSTNILQRLEGLVPGLVVNNAPNSQALLIRGLTSLNSTRSPLIIVDGVELQNTAIGNVAGGTNPIAGINPQDVADITVLKDATAASIWGSKASNGVIVITTKRGAKNEKIRVHYDMYYSFQDRPDLSYIPRFNSQEFIQFAKEVFPEYAPNTTWTSVKSAAPVPPHLQVQYNRFRGLISQAQADEYLDSLASINNIEQRSDIFYRDALSTNHTLSLSGGGNVYSFYGSLSYTGIKNNTPGQKNNSYKMNLRQDLNFGSWLQLSINTDLTNTVTGGNNIANVPSGTNIVPYQLYQDDNGNPLPAHYLPANSFSDSLRLIYQARSRIVNLDFIPLNEINSGYSKGDLLSGRIIGGAKVNLIKGLRFEGTYGYYMASSNSRTVLSEGNYLVRRELLDMTQAANVNTVPRYWLPITGGRKTENVATQKNWTVRNQFIFDQSWEQHQLAVLAGQEATSNTPVATQVVYRGWNDQLQSSIPVNYDTLGKGISGTITGARTVPYNMGGGEGVVTRSTSYYSNLSYTYLSKYNFNASWRIDRSNLFGFDKSAQNRPVWSVGGKWMMGREKFMTPIEWINRLDVRLTYGITGNAPQPGQSASYDILAAAEANPNYVTGSGTTISTPANDKLTWERTTVFNTGFDFAILGGRLGGSMDIYMKKTSDLIGPFNVAPLTGYESVTGNFGDLENKGIEFSLHSVNVRSADFSWTSGFNLAYNKNKITKLATSTPITTGPAMIGTRYLVGYPAFTMFGYNYGGLNSVGDPQIIRADKTLFAEANGSLAEDVLYLGSSQPLWTGGLFNNFTYKTFQLGFNISYNLGHVFFRDANSFWGGVVYSNSMHPEFANRWKVAGDETRTNIPRFAGSNAINNNRNTGYYNAANINSFDASFVKIRDITFSYGLPKNLLNRIKSQEVTFRFQVNNLMLWTANDLGIDPEFQSYNGGRSLPSGQGAITIGAHVTF